jgi:predicted membrane protein
MDPEWRLRRWSREDGRGEGRAVAGLIVIAFGVLFLLENLGYVYVRDLWDFWPVILIGLGISRMVNCHNSSGMTTGLILALVGGLFLAHNLGYIPYRIANMFWPLVLILFGLRMLLRRGGPWQPRPWMGRPFDIPNQANDSANRTSQFAVFGGSRRRVTSQQYEGGDALAIFGGIKIDLREANSANAQVFVEANALFGGIDIRVPDSWDVSIRGIGIFGGFDDMSRLRSPQPGKPTLVVTGTAMFGGVAVKG